MPIALPVHTAVWSPRRDVAPQRDVGIPRSVAGVYRLASSNAPSPPQTTSSVPVQTAVCLSRPMGGTFGVQVSRAQALEVATHRYVPSATKANDGALLAS